MISNYAHRKAFRLKCGERDCDFGRGQTERARQHIRADPRLMALRVVAYTAHVLLEEQQRFLAGGFDAVLLKPISSRAVRELLMSQTPYYS